MPRRGQRRPNQRPARAPADSPTPHQRRLTDGAWWVFRGGSAKAGPSSPCAARPRSARTQPSQSGEAGYKSVAKRASPATYRRHLSPTQRRADHDTHPTRPHREHGARLGAAHHLPRGAVLEEVEKLFEICAGLL